MKSKNLWCAVGLMSGTSMDGVDAALIETDGKTHVRVLGAVEQSYDDGFRTRLRSVMGGKGEVEAVEREITERHADAVARLLGEIDVAPEQVDVIGFHGQTILHQPDEGKTWQIGDGALLCRKTGVSVVNDFRSNDVAAGGEGAPFAPAYHRALANGLELPLAVVNLGGVANVTWIGEGEGEFLGFDTGPANALIDDWVKSGTGQMMDIDGRLAAAGSVDQARLAALMDHPYFLRQPPKSLDRDDFAALARPILDGLSVEGGAALLSAFTALSVAESAKFFPSPVLKWILTGGGRLNPVLVRMLQEKLGDVPVQPVEDVGWNGSSLEAEAFAYLAVRSRLGLPLSYPGTTGVSAPISGGVLYEP